MSATSPFRSNRAIQRVCHAGGVRGRHHLRVARATICLPTYNEIDNLEPMVRALADVRRPDDRVLVIDDASPDGTGELADRLAAELDWVGVLHRAEKQGIGPAYIDGLPRALAEGAELILEMDCDFSHDPASVGALIEACESGADLALGSRYVDRRQHGQLGSARRFISRGGLALRPYDPRGGRARPHRRVQVLPPRPRSRRSTSTRSRPAATASRSKGRIASCGRGCGSSRCRSRSPTDASARRR